MRAAAGGAAPPAVAGAGTSATFGFLDYSGLRVFLLVILCHIFFQLHGSRSFQFVLTGRLNLNVAGFVQRLSFSGEPGLMAFLGADVLSSPFPQDKVESSAIWGALLT